MKAFVRNIFFTGSLAIGATGLLAAAANDSWIDQWYKAKSGRSSPMEEARQKAERANTAFREETTREDAPPASSWIDQWYKAKFGRNSPMEEARRKAEGQ
jgi:hypothetical protein